MSPIPILLPSSVLQDSLQSKSEPQAKEVHISHGPGFLLFKSIHRIQGGEAEAEVPAQPSEAIPEAEWEEAEAEAEAEHLSQGSTKPNTSPSHLPNSSPLQQNTKGLSFP